MSAFWHTYVQESCVAKARMCHYFAKYILCFMLIYITYIIMTKVMIYLQSLSTIVTVA